MTQYKIVISDPHTDVHYGTTFIDTPDDIEAFYWVQDIVIDYMEHYDMFLIADVSIVGEL